MKKELVIIGGSYGIGREIVERLHSTCTIHVLCRTGLGELGVNYIPFDVNTGEIELSELPEKIDGLVYCPGSITLKPFKNMHEEAFKRDMDINFFGLIRTVRICIDRMAKGSNILFFSTVAASIGMPFHTSVAAAKGAVEGFARALAAELAPNVHVNVIAPSLTDTPLASTLLKSESNKEKIANRHPLKRIGRPADMAGLAAYLLTASDHWITGQVLRVDGGISTLNLM